MKIPPLLESQAARLKEGERFVAVTDKSGALRYELSLHNEVMRWEVFPDAANSSGSWTFGEATLPAAHSQEFARLFEDTFSYAHEGSGTVEVSLLWRKGRGVEYRRLHAPNGPAAASSPAPERLVYQCSNQVAAWANGATTDQSYLCFATNALGLQWVGPESVILVRRTGASIERVRCDFARLAEREELVRSLERHAVPAIVHTRAEALVPRPVPAEGPAFVMATRRGGDTLVVQSAVSDASFDRLFEALKAPQKTAAGAAATKVSVASLGTPLGAALEAPLSASSDGLSKSERAEIEERLGGAYKLDGSFASLWALEEILIPIRRAPRLGLHLTWMAKYLADLFERAFVEMGMKVERESPSRISVSAPITYRLDTRTDLMNLIRPPKALPTFHGIRWLGSAGLGSAMVPWYGLSTIFQNNAWAETNHDMIGRQRDRMDRAVPWLRKEYARVLELDESHRPLAEKVARAMVWPPLGYAQNEFGSHNFSQLKQAVADADAGDTRAVLDAFVAGQDRACQLLAAGTSLHFAIPPDTRHEALVYRDAAKFFRLEVPPFIKKSIEEHAAPLETPNVDASHPDYAAVYDAKPPLGLKFADAVLAKEPNLPTFHCARGQHLEALKNPAAALAAYDEAIRLKPDYVQARINRGTMYATKADFDRADSDFFEARKVRPDDADLRGNLILNHYFAKSKAAEQKAEKARSTTATPATTPAATPQQSAPIASSSPTDFTAQQEAAGQELRALLRRFSAKQASQNDVLRALMSYEHYLVPALVLPETHVGKHALLLSQSQSLPPGQLWVFTDAVAARRTQEVHPTLGLYTGGINAVTLLSLFDPRKFTHLRVNPKGPEEENFIFKGAAIGLLHAWATGLSVESSAESNDDVRMSASLSHHPGLMLAYRNGRLALEQHEGKSLARAAATIDRSLQMDRRLGTQSRPVPGNALKHILKSGGASGFYLEGTSRALPLDVLG